MISAMPTTCRTCRMRSAIGLAAIVAVLLQSGIERSAALPLPVRSIRLAGGGRVSVQRSTSEVGGKGEVVEVFDRNGQQISRSWCTGASGSYDAMVALFRRLNKALAVDDRPSVVALIRFPLQVNGGRSERISTPAELLKRYQHVLTPGVRRALLQASPEAVFCTSEGATASDGTVWASTNGGRTAIDVVNR